MKTAPKTLMNRRGGWLRWALGAFAAAALAAVFAAYLNPHFAVDLTNRFWACF